MEVVGLGLGEREKRRIGAVFDFPNDGIYEVSSQSPFLLCNIDGHDEDLPFRQTVALIVGGIGRARGSVGARFAFRQSHGLATDAAITGIFFPAFGACCCYRYFPIPPVSTILSSRVDSEYNDSKPLSPDLAAELFRGIEEDEISREGSTESTMWKPAKAALARLVRVGRWSEARRFDGVWSVVDKPLRDTGG